MKTSWKTLRFSPSGMPLMSLPTWLWVQVGECIEKNQLRYEMLWTVKVTKWNWTKSSQTGPYLFNIIERFFHQKLFLATRPEILQYCAPSLKELRPFVGKYFLKAFYELWIMSNSEFPIFFVHILSWDCPERCSPCHCWSPVQEVGDYVFCTCKWVGGGFHCHRWVIQMLLFTNRNLKCKLVIN